MWKTGLVPGLPFALAQRSGPNCGLRQQRPSEATCGLPQRWFRAPQVFARREAKHMLRVSFCAGGEKDVLRHTLNAFFEGRKACKNTHLL